jgi:hypothetical protein
MNPGLRGENPAPNLSYGTTNRFKTGHDKIRIR